MENKNISTTAAALFLVAGGIIGAGVALLYAPQSGERTRRDLGRYGKRVKQRADETIEDISVSFNDLVENLGARTDELLGRGKDAAAGSRKDLVRLIEEGASRLEKFRTKLSRAA